MHCRNLGRRRGCVLIDRFLAFARAPERLGEHMHRFCPLLGGGRRGQGQALLRQDFSLRRIVRVEGRLRIFQMEREVLRRKLDRFLVHRHSLGVLPNIGATVGDTMQSFREKELVLRIGFRRSPPRLKAKRSIIV